MPDRAVRMSSWGRSLVMATICAGGYAVVSACTSTVTGTAQSADPVSDPPAVGTCLALPGSDVEKLTIFVDRVSCDDPAYTGQVFATPDLTELGDDPLSTYERRDVEQVIGSACNEAALDDFLGAEAVETPFVRTTFFTPTDKQWSTGARWAYCVVTYGAETVRPAPGVMQDAFSRAPAAGFRTCLRLEGFILVPCSQPHEAEYTGDVIDFGPNPLNPLEDPARLPDALATCLAAFDAYVPQPPDPQLDYSVTAPPPAEYDPAVGVEVRCAVYYQDMMPRSTSVRD